MKQGYDSVMNTIYEAASMKTTIDINYVDRKGEVSTRRVEPYEIRNGDLYAYCIKKGGIRRFKIENIRFAENTGHIFSPRWEIKI